MGQNEGFTAQASDLPLSKASFSASAVSAATPVTLNPGNSGGAPVAGVPALGALGGKLVSAMPILGLNPALPPSFGPPNNPGASVPQLTGSLPPNGVKINGLIVQFLGSANPADAALTVKFEVYVQRQTLKNAGLVASQGAIPAYAPPVLAPTSMMSSGPISVAAVSGLPAPQPTQAFLDFSTSGPLDTVPGDTVFVVATCSGALAAPITNVQVSLN